MSVFVQQLVDGIGQGSIYALLALSLAVIFGVMHLVNFAHGELITVSAYVAYGLSVAGYGWAVIIPAILVTSVITSIAIEFLAFRWVRGSDEFTMLLTSFGVHFVVSALFLMFVSPKPLSFPKPGWIFNTVNVAGISFEVFDLVTVAATLATLYATAWVLRKTMFGITLRAASLDFDAARLMGVRSNGVIRGAFAMAGVLAGVAGVFWLMRTGTASPTAGLTPLLFGVIAVVAGGLDSLRGAVVGGFALGIVQVMLRGFLPPQYSGLTEGLLFVLLALLFIFRPQGLITVSHAERV
ncbi:MAG: branched-chain amino acid ABC transporter permease [Acidimicrobiia bacterium]